MRLSRLLALTAAIGVLAGAVQAQPVTPLTVKDGGGNLQPLCEYRPDGTNLAGCTVKWVWTGSAWALEPTGAGTAAGAPRAVVAQDSSTVAGSSSLPAGANIVGKFGIDQTSPGATNAVQATNFPASVSTGAGAAGASSPRYTVAQDGSTIAGSTPGGFTQPVSGQLSTSGGWTPKLVNGLSSTAVTLKSAAGQMGLLQCYNPNASQAYVQLIDSGAVGTPVLSIPIAPNATGGFALSLVGVQFTTSIKVAATTTATGTTAPTTPLDCNAGIN